MRKIQGFTLIEVLVVIAVIAVLEALVHGARCLASDIPAHRELVDNDEMLFPLGDSQRLYKKSYS